MKSIKVRHAKTIPAQIRGLIGQEKIEPLLLETRFGIHTFGMKKPIEVLILDNNFQVRKLKTNLKPWRIFIWNPRFQKVVELPSGFIKKENIRIQDKVSLIKE